MTYNIVVSYDINHLDIDVWNWFLINASKRLFLLASILRLRFVIIQKRKSPNAQRKFITIDK